MGSGESQSGRRIVSFALVDGNNFFVSCHRVFDRNLMGKNVVVLSSGDGCVVARSQEAKSSGIKMGEPWFKIKNNHSETIALSSNFELYADMSHRFATLLGEYGKPERYSIDECFIFFPEDSERDHESVGREIKRKCQNWLGLPVCIGIGKTKTLAKFANMLAKKGWGMGGVVIWENLLAEEKEKILDSIKVDEIWGIGSSSALKLNDLNIFTCLDYINADVSTLSIPIRRTQNEMKGKIEWDFEANPQPPQSISMTRTLTSLLADEKRVALILKSFAEDCRERLAENGLKANWLEIIVEGDRFKGGFGKTGGAPITESGSLGVSEAVDKGIEIAWKMGFPIKRLGVVMTKISTLKPFDQNEGDRIISEIKKKFGGRAIGRGGEMSRVLNGLIKKDALSNRWTTRRDEVPMVES